MPGFKKALFAASKKYNVDAQLLGERVRRALSYMSRCPGTTSRDAAAAVLNTDLGAHPKTESAKNERNAYARAMRAVFGALQTA
jgi:hypothetical protein